MNGMELFLNLAMTVMLGGAGIYAIYTAIRLQRDYELFENRILYPANCPRRDCKDVVGFIDFITPRLWVMGALCLILAVFMVLSKLAGLISLPEWADLYLLPLLGVGVFVWYISVNSRCAKKYW